jgi:serine/threonine-protein kinase RsbW
MPDKFELARRTLVAVGQNVADFRLTMSIDSKLDHVWLMRVSVAAILRELNVAEVDGLHVQLAIVEGINNCIEHSYAERPDGVIDVSIEAHPELLLIEIQDDGPPVPIEQLRILLRRPIPEVNDPRTLLPSGRGLQIMRDTMDIVEFTRRDNRNVLTLGKNLRRFCAD